MNFYSFIFNPFKSTKCAVRQVNKVRVKGLGLNISFQEYEETCLFIIAGFSASESLQVYINILKIPPPFASSDGYPASGIRYESVGA